MPSASRSNRCGGIAAVRCQLDVLVRLLPKISKRELGTEAKGKELKVWLNGELSAEMDLALWTSATKNPNDTDIPSWLSPPLRRTAHQRPHRPPRQARRCHRLVPQLENQDSRQVGNRSFTPPLFPALRSDHRHLQRPSPEKNFSSWPACQWGVSHAGETGGALTADSSVRQAQGGEGTNSRSNFKKFGRKNVVFFLAHRPQPCNKASIPMTGMKICCHLSWVRFRDWSVKSS